MPRMSELPRTERILRRGVEEGLHPGAQLFVWRDGRVVADLAVGRAALPERPMTADSVTCWFSAGKPLTAVAVGQLIERGEASLNDPVAKFIPEFAGRGKQAIALRYLLTHTGGLRFLPGEDRLDWDQVIDRINAMKIEPGWTVGEKAGYHVAASWYVLGEIIRRLTGEPIDAYLRDHVFAPLAMRDCWLGIPRDVQEAIGERLAHSYDTSGDQPVERDGEADERRREIAAVRPGRNVRGPARQLGRFYATLLNGGVDPETGGVLCRPETVSLLTHRHRDGMFDHTFKAVIDWGLGFMLNSTHHQPSYPYDFGTHASADAFGHGGWQCANAFADPAHQLAVVWVANGHPGEPAHQQRNRAINAAVYEDLGLV